MHISILFEVRLFKIIIYSTGKYFMTAFVVKNTHYKYNIFKIYLVKIFNKSDIWISLLKKETIRNMKS